MLDFFDSFNGTVTLQNRDSCVESTHGNECEDRLSEKKFLADGQVTSSRGDKGQNLVVGQKEHGPRHDRAVDGKAAQSFVIDGCLLISKL